MNIPANICHEVLVKIEGQERKECVLSLLLTLLDAKQDEDLVDKKDAMEEIVALLQGLPFESKAVRKAKDIIREHERRKAAAAEEGLSEEELRLKRLRESKERQKAILAQFAVKQKQFLAGNQELADSDAGDADPLSKKGEVAMEGIDIGVGATAEGDSQELETCVMCKEGFLPKDPLGRLAYVQTSGVLETARRRAYEARYGGQRIEKEADADKGKGKEKEKEKEKETEGTEQGKADVQMQEAEGDEASVAHSASPTAMTLEDSAAGASSAPAEVAEGGSAQSSSGESKEGVATHALKERMGWLQEMTRNVTEGSNAHCFSCQHLMHVNCSKCPYVFYIAPISNALLFLIGHKHCLQLLQDAQRMNDIYLPLSQKRILGGEFLCPLCRTLANTLIPVVPHQDRLAAAVKQRTSEGEEGQAKVVVPPLLEQWKQEHHATGRDKDEVMRERAASVTETLTRDREGEGEEAPLLEGEQEYREALLDFGCRVYAAQKGVGIENVDVPIRMLPPALSSLVNNISIIWQANFLI